MIETGRFVASRSSICEAFHGTASADNNKYVSHSSNVVFVWNLDSLSSAGFSDSSRLRIVVLDDSIII